MWSKRAEVSYALQRRNSVAELRRPQPTLEAAAVVADSALLSSTPEHGEAVAGYCPACDQPAMVNLNFVSGEPLGQLSGQVKTNSELVEMQNQYEEFQVSVVEVCAECAWNHMITKYLLGDGSQRRPPRRQQTAEDIYG